MGHDATMQIGGESNAGALGGFIVTADKYSTKYKDAKKIDYIEYDSNQLNDLLFLEGRAIFIAKLLKVDLKLNNR